MTMHFYVSLHECVVLSKVKYKELLFTQTRRNCCFSRDVIKMGYCIANISTALTFSSEIEMH